LLVKILHESTVKLDLLLCGRSRGVQHNSRCVATDDGDHGGRRGKVECVTSVRVSVFKYVVHVCVVVLLLLCVVGVVCGAQACCCCCRPLLWFVACGFASRPEHIPKENTTEAAEGAKGGRGEKKHRQGEGRDMRAAGRQFGVLEHAWSCRTSGAAFFLPEKRSLAQSSGRHRPRQNDAITHLDTMACALCSLSHLHASDWCNMREYAS